MQTSAKSTLRKIFDKFPMTSAPKEFSIGSTVRLSLAPPYFKTAEPMPMLRPPQLIPLGETGTVLERRPAEYWVVKFPRGSFLLDGKYLESVEDDTKIHAPAP
jgi:Protein of unknown function (DUF3148)